MYNSKPSSSDLPTSRQLLRSTVIALIAAGVLLVTVVLPAEYAIDPTGIGRMLGLTEMGEIKAQLAEEAAIDAARDAAAAAAAGSSVATPATAPAPQPATSASTASTATTPATGDSAWRDEMRVTLDPGQGAEVKLVMKAGARAQFSWLAEGGEVNFDTHGDGGGQSISYEKGRGVPSDEGVLEAAFDGNHGWFWRNRGDGPVTVVIRASGDYSEMIRVV